MTKSFKKIGIVGMGAWGTAIASIAASNAEEVICYTRDIDVIKSVNYHNINIKYLPDFTLQNNIKATNLLEDIQTLDILCLAVPSQVLRSVLLQILTSNYPINIPLIICTKGIENSSQKLISQVIQELKIDSPIAIFSGPNFATEIMTKKPAAAIIACQDEQIGKKLLSCFQNQYFYTYYSNDIIGVQLCGAIKNVIAIATGIAVGLDMGDNAHAAIVTRGINEILNITLKMGGNIETVIGLAGIGDLILTCSSPKSRNRSFGYHLALDPYTKSLIQNQTVEGYHTAAALNKLCDTLNIKMPISYAVYKILYEEASIKTIEEAMFSYPQKMTLNFSNSEIFKM